MASLNEEEQKRFFELIEGKEQPEEVDPSLITEEKCTWLLTELLVY